VDEWGRGRAGELARIFEEALPHEHLTEDELLACCWDDPGVVLADPDGEGAVAAVTRPVGDGTHGWIKALAVTPGARRLGLGSRLVAAAETWSWDQGSGQVRWGDCGPFYLWPGIDVGFTAALCLAEVTGYFEQGAWLNMSCPTTFRSAPPDGVTVRRALADGDADAVLAVVREHYPWWEDEVVRGVEQGGTLGAFAEDGAAIGFGCHSVNRAGWVGPMGTDPARQSKGVGSAVLGELCKDLMVAGHRDAEIAWVGPVAFYAKAAGAAVSRVFRTVWKPRP
jgi:GNAT superfamily N-acetyltransferase